MEPPQLLQCEAVPFVSREALLRERLSNQADMRAPLARWTASIGARILSGEDDEDDHEEDVSTQATLTELFRCWSANPFPTLSFGVYPGHGPSSLIINVS